MTLVCFSPAKLNLFLHIVGRREDGYHLLQTIFQLLDYGDTLTISLRHDTEIDISCQQVAIPLQQNLCYKAVQLVQDAFQIKKGVTIELDKKIPIGAGLGGGSSNAAATLWALNDLWQLGCSLEDLLALGVTLGADVPVFIRGRSAFAEGIGEKLEPLILPTAWFVVVVPATAVATVEIYRAPELTRDTAACKMCDLPPLCGVEDGIFEFGHNDMQPVVLKHNRAVAKAFEWISGFGPARMTGSGGAVFMVAKNQQHAQAVVSQIPAGMAGFCAKGVNFCSWADCKKAI